MKKQNIKKNTLEHVGFQTMLKLQTVEEDLMEMGSWFQREGPYTLKDLSPILLVLLGTTRRVMTTDERRPSRDGKWTAMYSVN